MRTLYEMTSDYLALLEAAEDPETDPVAFEDTLEAIGGEIEIKADGYAKVIRQLDADIAGVKQELDRLNARKTAMETNARRMKDALQNAMELIGREKIKTDLFSFNIQNNPPAVILDTEDPEKIPFAYHIPQAPKIDKKAIKADLEAGKDLTGIAHLEQGRSLRIR